MNDILGTGGYVDPSYHAAYFNAQKPKAVTTTVKKKKNGFLDLLSTGGGIGGALAGGAAGAAAGSIVPVAGTAIGGILGAILGGAVGSGGGEVAENAINGDALDTNVVNEALIGGATSLPIGAGFKLANAGLKLGTSGALGFGAKSAGQLVREAGAATVPKKVAASLDFGLTKSAGIKAAGKVSNTADKLMAAQSGMTASQARALNIKPVQTFGNINGRTGLTKLDDMAEVGRNVTGKGENSLLDTLTNAAIAEAPGVKINSLRKTAQNIMDNGASLLTPQQRKQVLENMKNAEVAIYGGAKGTLSALGNPEATLKQANSFRDAARKLGNGFNPSPQDKQLAQIYNSVASDMEKSLYSARGVNDSIPTLVKAGRDDMLFKAQAAREAGNEAQAKAYEKLANEIVGAKSVQDLRSMKKDFVNLGKIDDATAQAEGARTLTGEQYSSGAANWIQHPIRNTAAAVANATALPLAAGAKRFASGGAMASAGQGVVPLAARQGITRALLSPQQPQADPMTLDAALNAPDASTQFPTEPVATTPTNPTGYSSQQLGQALMQAYAAGDKASADVLGQMYDLATQFEQASAAPDLSNNAQKNLTAAANAETALQQIEAGLQEAGGGGGFLGGGIANALSGVGLNNSARLYNDQLQSYVPVILQALGKTDAPSEAELKGIIATLPQISDTPENAKAKLAGLRARIAAAQQNTLTFGGGGTDLESVLAGY